MRERCKHFNSSNSTERRDLNYFADLILLDAILLCKFNQQFNFKYNFHNKHIFSFVLFTSFSVIGFDFPSIHYTRTHAFSHSRALSLSLHVSKQSTYKQCIYKHLGRMQHRVRVICVVNTYSHNGNSFKYKYGRSKPKKKQVSIENALQQSS